MQDPRADRNQCFETAGKKKNFQENSGPSTRSGGDNSDLTRGLGWFLFIPVKNLVVLEVLLDKLLSLLWWGRWTLSGQIVRYEYM